MKRCFMTTTLALAFVSILVPAGPAAAGEPVPFKGFLEGDLTNRVPYPAPPVFRDTIETTGAATQLGSFELIEVAVVDFGTTPPQAAGIAMFLAANGDTVTAEFYGSSELVEPGVVLITEYATITGGTGRFAGAAGSYTVKRLFDLTTFETIGYFDGIISVSTP